MTLEEVKKLLEKKNEEIALLTKALVVSNKANNHAYGLLSCSKEGY